MIGVGVHHGQWLRNQDRYREKLLRLLVDRPFGVTTQHDDDGACCRIEAWETTAARIMAIVDEDPAAWWKPQGLHVAPPDARWLWSDAYPTPAAHKQPTTAKGEPK